jgi:hypothetical protein
MVTQKRSQKIKKESESLKVNLPRKNSGRIKRFLESRLILEDWQIKVSKMIKTRKKTYFPTRLCTKEHLKTEGLQKFRPYLLGMRGIFRGRKLDIGLFLSETPPDQRFNQPTPEHPIRRQVVSFQFI